MKKITCLLFLLTYLNISSFGQKYAYVDSEYILENIPSFKAAEEELNQISEDYQNEIEELYDEVSALYEKYETDKIFLSNEMKIRKENEIVQKEQILKNKKQQYFSPRGTLFKKRQELIKPIQDEVYNSIKQISEEKGYTVIFDKSGNSNIMYSNPKYDISDEVLSKLGYIN